MSDLINEKIQEWRRRSAEGTMTIADYREAIESIRKERVQAQETSTKSKARKTKQAPEAVDSDGLLGELGL